MEALVMIGYLFQLAASIAREANLKRAEIDAEWSKSRDAVFDRPVSELPEPPP